MIVRLLGLICLTSGILWPAPAEAQIFGRGARTEFITGFGVRTFASFFEMTAPTIGDGVGSGGVRRSISVRVTPVSVVYGLRRTVSVIGIFPLVDKRLRATAPDGSTTEIAAGTGLGDATFLAKWRLFTRDRGRGTLRIALEAGVKAPSGASDLRGRNGALLPRTLQRGSGSWDPTGDLSLTWVPDTQAGRWMFTGDVGATLTSAADGFEQGDRLAYDTMAKYRIRPARYPGREVFLLFEVNGRWQDRARSDGLQLVDSGGHVVYLSPGVQYLLRGNLILEGGVQIPVFQRLNGMQLEPGYNVLFGLRYIIVP